jgi:hypothetical protein
MSEAQSQAAPAPDYASGLPPDVEVCGCDEALALRAEVTRLTGALAAAEPEHLRAKEPMYLSACARADAAEARCRVLEGRQGPSIASTGPRTRGAGSSRFKGVYWHAKSGKWRARVRAGDKRLSLGAFASEDEAAGAIDRALHVMGAIRGA